ncbi:response regulator [Armatimonas rosea]|uniref:DNA-binding NtrC family response regulator n=1 Tax=Armatimonas rosea TaxID=685828 RepID=A0A7W9SU57_ARMRO|nr:response regulator [Armatimonas rosea]MBB6052882.1 DNA-binding NtrC family response regulator [Armatimonas rosea]
MSKILIAEDEDGLRMLLERQLTRSGYTVHTAQDGQAALEALLREPFDLVISDMKMPRLDGMGLLREAQERHLPIDFVVLTGHGSLEGAVEAFKNGNVADYLLKPLEDIRMLSRIVAKALEARRLKEENARLSTALPETRQLEQLLELTECYLSLVQDRQLSVEEALVALPQEAPPGVAPSLTKAFITMARQRIASPPELALAA